MPTFDWSRFEDALFEELERALARLGKQHRGERFYAVALNGVYGEADGVLCLPLLGAGAVKDGDTNEARDFWSAHWNPADWSHPEVPVRHRPMLQLEKALTREATASTPAHWVVTHSRYYSVLVRVARRLRDRAPELLNVTDDFVAFVSDESGGPELARKTIPAPLFERLFASTVADQKKRSAVKTLAPADRAAFLVTRLDACDGVSREDAEPELVALGEKAVPHLLAVLEEPDKGWAAAGLLGSIGVASDAVLKALRKQARDGLWPAMALGMLRDNEWLMRQGDVNVAVLGLTAPLKAIATGYRRPPLDYRPLESYLTAAGATALRRAENELEPGSSYCSIGREDIPEALRGLTSPYAVIRWHAASILGDRELGKAAGQQILPALARQLGDRHRVVRRLALLAMSYWKAAAKPYREAITALADDPDETVRRIAQNLLR